MIYFFQDATHQFEFDSRHNYFLQFTVVIATSRTPKNLAESVLGYKIAIFFMFRSRICKKCGSVASFKLLDENSQANGNEDNLQPFFFKAGQPICFIKGHDNNCL